MKVRKKSADLGRHRREGGEFQRQSRAVAKPERDEARSLPSLADEPHRVKQRQASFHVANGRFLPTPGGILWDTVGATVGLKLQQLFLGVQPLPVATVSVPITVATLKLLSPASLGYLEDLQQGASEVHAESLRG